MIPWESCPNFFGPLNYLTFLRSYFFWNICLDWYLSFQVPSTTSRKFLEDVPYTCALLPSPSAPTIVLDSHWLLNKGESEGKEASRQVLLLESKAPMLT